jgi:hypothetical protein
MCAEYIHESYEEALKRELDECGASYDPNDILKSAISDVNSVITGATRRGKYQHCNSLLRIY